MYKKLLFCIIILTSYNATTQTGILDTLKSLSFHNDFTKLFGAQITSGLLTTGFLYQQEGSLNKDVLTAGVVSFIATELIYPAWATRTFTSEQKKQMGILKYIFNYTAGLSIAWGLGTGYVYFNYLANR